MKGARFKRAVEASDPEALGESLAGDVRFFSPVVFAPYEGRALVGRVLGEAALKVLADLRWVEAAETEDGAALGFEARVAERRLEGVFWLRVDASDRVCELTVFVRPMSGLHALAGAMAAEFERLGVTVPKHA